MVPAQMEWVLRLAAQEAAVWGCQAPLPAGVAPVVGARCAADGADVRADTGMRAPDTGMRVAGVGDDSPVPFATSRSDGEWPSQDYTRFRQERFIKAQ